jgi:hypothetical protein
MTTLIKSCIILLLCFLLFFDFINEEWMLQFMIDPKKSINFRIIWTLILFLRISQEMRKRTHSFVKNRSPVKNQTKIKQICNHQNDKSRKRKIGKTFLELYCSMENWEKYFPFYCFQFPQIPCYWQQNSKLYQNFLDDWKLFPNLLSILKI